MPNFDVRMPSASPAILCPCCDVCCRSAAYGLRYLPDDGQTSALFGNQTASRTLCWGHNLGIVATTHFFHWLGKWENCRILLKILQRRVIAFWGRCLKEKLGMLLGPGALRFFKDLIMVRMKIIKVSERKWDCWFWRPHRLPNLRMFWSEIGLGLKFTSKVEQIFRLVETGQK